MYYDLLVRIKNGLQAKKETVHAPFSEFDLAVARFLQDTGYVAAVDKRVAGKKASLEIKLKYKDGAPAITGFKFHSKPSRRLYRGYREIRSVRQGQGIAALSSPEGIVSDRDARKRKLGGEYLFEIW